MLTIHKAVCCVVQEDSLLCFEHPTGGRQIPKGTVEAGESPDAASLRELWEESGLRLDGPPVALGEFESFVGGGPDERGALERQVWHVFAVRASGLPEQWTHIAQGSAAEDGLAFRFFWHPLAARAHGFQPSFLRVIDLVKNARHAF
jgi:8-oxo-dGTP pyrophosphatase MutT (NUDIX family)